MQEHVAWCMETHESLGRDNKNGMRQIGICHICTIENDSIQLGNQMWTTIKKHIQKRNVRAKPLLGEDSFFSLPRRDIQVPTRGPFSLPIPFQISLILEVCPPAQRLLRHFSQRYWKLYLGRSQAHSGRPSTFLSVLSRICFVKVFFVGLPRKAFPIHTWPIPSCT